MAPEKHEHDWRELGRVFPLTEADFDLAYLSPDGLHHPDVEDGTLHTAQEALGRPKMAKLLADKVPVPTPHVIIQCADGECKDVKHIELNDSEWKAIQAAHASGAFDPSGRGTNDFLSQASLDELGLSRISKMLSDEGRSSSGASRFAFPGVGS